MKELIESLDIVESAESLFDTCFFLYELKHHKHVKGAITSFNGQEIIHVAHKLHDDLKQELRHALKNHDLSVLNISVNPGDFEAEKNFVNQVDPRLLQLIPDASDAVLIAAAIKFRVKKVYTRDKHHLYTDKLGNYLQGWGIEVLNKYES